MESQWLRKIAWRTLIVGAGLVICSVALLIATHPAPDSADACALIGISAIALGTATLAAIHLITDK